MASRVRGLARAAFGSGVLVLAACSKPAPAPGPDAASVASVASVAPRTGDGPAAASTTWSGTYAATPGTLSVPDGGEWSGWRFHGDDASDGLGPGSLTLTVDGATGRAEGQGDGSLGALVVSGVAKDGELALRLAPRDARDDHAGFTGYALGKVEGASVSGTMHLSTPTGNVIREATFTLAKR